MSIKQTPMYLLSFERRDCVLYIDIKITWHSRDLDVVKSCQTAEKNTKKNYHSLDEDLQIRPGGSVNFDPHIESYIPAKLCIIYFIWYILEI